MTDKTLKDHVRKCGDLKAQIDTLTALFNAEKESITNELNNREISDFANSKYAIKLAKYTSSRLDSKKLKADDPTIYEKYLKQYEQSRFTVTAI